LRSTKRRAPLARQLLIILGVYAAGVVVGSPIALSRARLIPSELAAYGLPGCLGLLTGWAVGRLLPNGVSRRAVALSSFISALIVTGATAFAVTILLLPVTGIYP